MSKNSIEFSLLNSEQRDSWLNSSHRTLDADNYEIHDKEMLVVVKCLEAQRYFLEGAVEKFEIWTDHKNLKYFIKVQKLNRRQARWALYLSRFNFTLKHVPGNRIGKADSLSRKPNWEIRVKKDNEDETLVKPEWLEVRKTGNRNYSRWGRSTRRSQKVKGEE